MEALGVAVGQVGMSVGDFEGLTPEEFEAIYRVWGGQREAEYRDGWERMRMLAAIDIQPHVKRKITPEKLLPFPWEKERHNRPNGHNGPAVSKEEDKRRLEALVGRG